MTGSGAIFGAWRAGGPGHVQARFNRGVVLMGLGREPEAGVEFERAAELEPGNPAVQRALGVWRERQKGERQDAKAPS